MRVMASKFKEKSDKKLLKPEILRTIQAEGALWGVILA